MAQQLKQFAVVTGASSGIGYELAKVFARNGFDLLVCAEKERIHEVARDFEIAGAKVDALSTDLATYEGVQKLYEKIIQLGRPVDAIAINAGIGLGGPFIEQDLQKIVKLINLNVTSTVHLAQLVIKDMVTRGQGRVLFTSSIAAMMPGSFEAIYGGSKAFVQSFSQAIREELKETGVTVTSLQPGPTETEFFQRADLDDTRVGTMKKDDAAEVAQAGFDAMMKGEDYVIPGSLMNKIFSAMGKFLPEKVSAAAHRKLSEPGTGKH